jgi:uncharacterized protein (DUF1684 family)
VVHWWNIAEATKTDGAVSLSAAGWMSLQIFRREAETLFSDQAFPADPFAR